MCSVHGRRSLGFGEGFPGKMSGKKYRESQPGEECMKGTQAEGTVEQSLPVWSSNGKAKRQWILLGHLEGREW